MPYTAPQDLLMWSGSANEYLRKAILYRTTDNPVHSWYKFRARRPPAVLHLVHPTGSLVAHVDRLGALDLLQLFQELLALRARADPRAPPASAGNFFLFAHIWTGFREIFLRERQRCHEKGQGKVFVNWFILNLVRRKHSLLPLIHCMAQGNTCWFDWFLKKISYLSKRNFWLFF